MAYKVVVLAALLAVTQAGIIGAPAVLAPGPPLAYAGHPAGPLAYAAPVAKAVGPVLAHGPVAYAAGPAAYAAGPAVAKVAGPAPVDLDFDPNPQYSYAYDIQDALTGDNKAQQETRNGDVVQGSYSLVEADGTRRTVDYTADPVNGFNAVVHREPAVVGKAVVAGPAIAKVAAPLGYAPPLGYAAPVAKVAAPLGFGHPAYAAPLHTKAIIG